MSSISQQQEITKHMSDIVKQTHAMGNNQAHAWYCIKGR